MNYGPLADLESCSRLMDNTLKEYIILKDTLGEVRQKNDVRDERNAQLRERLTNMRADVQ